MDGLSEMKNHGLILQNLRRESCAAMIGKASNWVNPEGDTVSRREEEKGGHFDSKSKGQVRKTVLYYGRGETRLTKRGKRNVSVPDGGGRPSPRAKATSRLSGVEKGGKSQGLSAGIAALSASCP